MFFATEYERLPVDEGWSVIYLPTYHKGNRENLVNSNQEDELTELIMKIAHSNETALEHLYDATVNRVYGMAMKIVLRPELAEEVVGDVYLQVWKQADKYKTSRASAIGWLLMICRSRALDKLRREKSATRNQYQEDEQKEIEDNHTPDPSHHLTHGELSKKITTALLLLNKSQRQMIALAFYKGLSHQQIAKHTRQPLGTVKSNIRRAQAILKNALNSEDINTGELYGQA